MVTPNGGVSNRAAAEAAGEGFEVVVLEEMGKTFAVPAARLVEIQTGLHDLDHLVFAEDPGQFARQARMAAEPPADLAGPGLALALKINETGALILCPEGQPSQTQASATIAPPPYWAELPVRMQLISVLEMPPPP